MFYVYVLISKSFKPITYVGYTKNLKKRIELHNSGKGAKFTRGRKWKLIFKKKYKTKSEAMKAEIEFKKNISFRNRVKNNFINNVDK